MVRRLAVLVVLIFLGVIAYLLLKGNHQASAESKYDGVHLCAPSQQEAATLAAKSAPTPVARSTPSPSSEASDNAGPLFAQNSAVWGGEIYDSGDKQDVGCGKTIAQCGCAMTSVATVLSLFQILSTPGGDSLNPSTLNSWFNQGATLTGGGWVSQGYSFGNVVWTAVNSFSATIPSTGEKRTVRFAGWSSGSEDEIRAQLAKGNPVVLEVPGHYIAAIGQQDGQILINDPYYRDRTTLSAYAGRVRSARLYEPSTDLGAILINVPADLRVKVTDSSGREVGTLGGKTPADAQKESASQIPGASMHFEEAWRDPTCTEKPPKDGQGVNTIFIPSPASGSYKVEVLNPDGKTTEAAVYVYDVKGVMQMAEHDGGKKLEFDVTYGSGGSSGPSSTATPTPTVTATTTETPTESPTEEPPTVSPKATEAPTEAPVAATDTPEPQVSPAAATDTPTAIATATATPTITPTPVPPMTVSPLSVQILPGNGTGTGSCFTRISWTAGGDPGGTVELLRGGATIATRSPGAFTYDDPFQAGTFSYQVRATNSNSTSFTTSAPVSVSPWCLDQYSVTNNDGTPYIAWNLLGAVAGGSYSITKNGQGLTSGAASPGPGNFYPDTSCPSAGGSYTMTVTVPTPPQVTAQPAQASGSFPCAPPTPTSVPIP